MPRLGVYIPTEVLGIGSSTSGHVFSPCHKCHITFHYIYCIYKVYEVIVIFNTTLKIKTKMIPWICYTKGDFRD